MLPAIKNGKVANGIAYREYMVIIKEREFGKYYFFFDDYKNVKDAKHIAKVLLKAVFQSNAINLANQDIYDSTEHIILHNAKNIIHNLTTGLRNQINYEELVYQEDKVKFIKALVEQDILKYSRELLRCEKALEQVAYEYNCLDLIKSGELLDSTDRTWMKIHSCLVQSFYIYENDFTDRRIRVNIEPNHKKIHCNFFSLRSAFALLFENCTKYCKENTEIDVSINEQTDGSIKLDFDMISVYNSDSELEKVFLEYRRGAMAMSKGPGQGLGLFLVQRLLAINGFSIDLKAVSNSDIYDSDGMHYCRNLFVIDIPLKFIR